MFLNIMNIYMYIYLIIFIYQFIYIYINQFNIYTAPPGARRSLHEDCSGQRPLVLGGLGLWGISWAEAAEGVSSVIRPELPSGSLNWIPVNSHSQTLRTDRTQNPDPDHEESA